MNLHGKNYKLVWEDHFEGDKLDPGYWDIKHYYNEGHGGRKAWRSPDNVSVKDSNLIITAKIEENGDYTSGMIKTDKQFVYQYGYAEIRAKLPVGETGVWPGFWMCGLPHAGRRGGSEIDVFEMFGDDSYIACNLHAWWTDRLAKTTRHINYLDGQQNFPKKIHLPNGAKFSDDYHTIGYEWTPELAQFLVDGEPYCSVRIDNPIMAVFHEPIYFIISMAFGLKNLSAPPEDITPRHYCIDYIRLYQNEDGKLYKVVPKENKEFDFEEIDSIYRLKTL